MKGRVRIKEVEFTSFLSYYNDAWSRSNDKMLSFERHVESFEQH